MPDIQLLNGRLKGIKHWANVILEELKALGYTTYWGEELEWTDILEGVLNCKHIEWPSVGDLIVYNNWRKEND